MALIGYCIHLKVEISDRIDDVTAKIHGQESNSGPLSLRTLWVSVGG
jgi:hypothetical protein